MLTYNPETQCPKCRGENLSAQYREKGERIDWALMQTEVAQESLIRRTCQTCGYAWNERPLDAAGCF